MSQNASPINYSGNSSNKKIILSGSELNKKYATDTTRNSDQKKQKQISINQKLESSLKRMEISTMNLLSKGREQIDEPRAGVSNFKTSK